MHRPDAEVLLASPRTCHITIAVSGGGLLNLYCSVITSKHQRLHTLYPQILGKYLRSCLWKLLAHLPRFAKALRQRAHARHVGSHPPIFGQQAGPKGCQAAAKDYLHPIQAPWLTIYTHR